MYISLKLISTEEIYILPMYSEGGIGLNQQMKNKLIELSIANP